MTLRRTDTAGTTRARLRILPEALAATVLWGGVFTAAKLGMQEIPVSAFLTARLLIAATLLVLISGGIGWARALGVPLRQFLVAGLAQGTFQVLLLQGIHHTSPALSAILLASAPLLTAAWLGTTGRERLAARQWAGLGLGFGGVVLLVSADGFAGGASLFGNLLAFGAAVAWAWYSLAIGPVTRAVGPIRAAAGTIGVAAVALLPFGGGELIGVPWGRISFAAWAGLLYGAVIGLVIATVLWVRSIERHGTQATMNYSYVEPVAAVIIAALVLGDVLRPVQALGGVCALLGVYLASVPPTRAR